MPSVRSAVLSTGVTLPYAEQGDAGGVPVLLLHAWADSRRFFDPLLPHLPSAVHACVPDQRGHGDAGKPESGYSPAHFAADAAAFMDAVGLTARELSRDGPPRGVRTSRPRGGGSGGVALRLR